MRDATAIVPFDQAVEASLRRRMVSTPVIRCQRVTEPDGQVHRTKEPRPCGRGSLPQVWPELLQVEASDEEGSPTYGR